LKNQGAGLIKTWYWIKEPFYRNGKIICYLIYHINYQFPVFPIQSANSRDSSSSSIPQAIQEQQKVEGKMPLCIAAFTLDKTYALPLIYFSS
jgi:hypothetical protein